MRASVAIIVMAFNFAGDSLALCPSAAWQKMSARRASIPKAAAYARGCRNGRSRRRPHSDLTRKGYSYLMHSTALQFASSSDDGDDDDERSMKQPGESPSPTDDAVVESEVLSKLYRRGQYVFGLVAAVIMLIQSICTGVIGSW